MLIGCVGWPKREASHEAQERWPLRTRERRGTRIQSRREKQKGRSNLGFRVPSFLLRFVLAVEPEARRLLGRLHARFGTPPIAANAPGTSTNALAFFSRSHLINIRVSLILGCHFQFELATVQAAVRVILIPGPCESCSVWRMRWSIDCSLSLLLDFRQWR